MNEQAVQQIEVNIETANATIARKEVFLRLVDNPDFKEIIEKGYFEDEAIRLVGALSSPTMADDVTQQELQKDMIGVGRLRQYFYAIVQQGRTAEEAVKSHEQELDYIAEEEAEALAMAEAE